ncbi:putative holin-like toxin [Furfurilactobacillus sp. WILCCON 0119]
MNKLSTLDVLTLMLGTAIFVVALINVIVQTISLINWK